MSLVLPFFTDDPLFIDGFECGKIYTMLRLGHEVIEETVHVCNKAQLEMICVTVAESYEFKKLDEFWMTISAIPKT